MPKVTLLVEGTERPMNTPMAVKIHALVVPWIGRVKEEKECGVHTFTTPT